MTEELSKTVSVRLKQSVYDLLEEYANRNGRSVSNAIRWVIERELWRYRDGTTGSDVHPLPTEQ